MPPNLDLSLIVTMTPRRVIGNKGSLPWDILTDLARSQKYTLEAGAVVVGRKAWESLFKKLRSFSGRTVIIMTRQAGYKAEGAIVVHSLEEALFEIKKQGGRACVIGGAEIFSLFLSLVQMVYVTTVHATEPIMGDAHFPEMQKNSWGSKYSSIVRKWLPQDDHPTSFKILKRIAP